MQLWSQVLQWLDKRRQQSNHRQLLVISGELSWVLDRLDAVLAATQPDSVFTLSNSISTADATNKSYKRALGQEYQYVVYDAFTGIRASALLALSGCVSKSGLMVLLCPKLDTWHRQPDPERLLRSSYQSNDDKQTSYFIKWLAAHIATDDYTCVLHENDFKQSLAPIISPPPACRDRYCCTFDQQKVVERIIEEFAHPRLQMVITANRGRGKSSALGIAAGLLLHRTTCSIAVTATHRSMTDKVFEQADRVLRDVQRATNNIPTTSERINFYALDALLTNSHHFDLLLIDEAATIPNQILEGLVKRATRIIFSTTVQGYEGSGRGFELRFKPFLQKHYPEHQSFTLDEPIRWKSGDVLEQFWFKAMAMESYQLNREPRGSEPTLTFDSAQLTHQRLNATQLICKPALLNELFSLLVEAHYQTSPDDLARLLDASDQHVIASFNPLNELIAVALVNLEGGEQTVEVAADVAKGTRRVPGHLSAQKLSYFLANESLMTLRYLRVVRIAVRDTHRGLGAGSALIKQVENFAASLDCDFVSTSFGLTVELLRFWSLNGFKTVHVGNKLDAASGEFSALLLKNNKPEHQNLLQQLCQFGMLELQFQRKHRLAPLSDTIIDSLLSQRPKIIFDCQVSASLNVFMRQFVQGNRPLHSIERQLYQWLSKLDATANATSSIEYRFLNDLIVKRDPAKAICSKYSLTGRKQVESFARHCVKVLLNTSSVTTWSKP